MHTACIPHEGPADQASICSSCTDAPTRMAAKHDLATTLVVANGHQPPSAGLPFAALQSSACRQLPRASLSHRFLPCRARHPSIPRSPPAPRRAPLPPPPPRAPDMHWHAPLPPPAPVPWYALACPPPFPHRPLPCTHPWPWPASTTTASTALRASGGAGRAGALQLI